MSVTTEFAQADDVRDYRMAVREYVQSIVAPSDAEDEGGHAGDDREAWTLGARQLGIVALMLSERHGGAGEQLAMAAAAVDELGAALVSGPFRDTLFAAWVLDSLGGGDAAELVASVVEGRVRLGVTFLGGPHTAGRSLNVSPRGQTADVDGFVDVQGAAMADRLMMVRSQDLLILDLDHPSVRIDLLTSLDITRGISRITVDGTAATVIHIDAADRCRIESVWRVLVSAEQIGLMRHVVEHGVAYAKQRQAFGRPIGSFQSVKHQLAELYCTWQHCDALLEYVLDEWNQGTDVETSAAALACLAAPAGVHLASESLRLLGGIGYTWEHEAHRYFRRARATELLLGNPFDLRRALADLVL